jgi:HK97 family phage prohead protease
MRDLERRSVTFEVRAVSEEAGARTFEGYGSVFDTIDSYNDTIVKGAYRQTLKEWKAKKKLPKMLLQHGGGGLFSANADDMVPIGKWEEMREDDHGLFMRGRLFDIDTDRAKATYAALKEGELDGLSIGFKTLKSKKDEETGIRTLTEIQLWEVSLVTFPANDPARVTGVKAADMTERQFEEFLREAGFPIAAAKTIVAKGYRALRDAAPNASNHEAAAAAELLALINRRDAILGG